MRNSYPVVCLLKRRHPRLTLSYPLFPSTSFLRSRGGGFLDVLRADEVDMRVDAAGGDDLACPGEDFGPRSDDDLDPGWMSGFPALPIAAIRPPRSAMSAL